MDLKKERCAGELDEEIHCDPGNSSLPASNQATRTTEVSLLWQQRVVSLAAGSVSVGINEWKKRILMFRGAVLVEDNAYKGRTLERFDISKFKQIAISMDNMSRASQNRAGRPSQRTQRSLERGAPQNFLSHPRIECSSKRNRTNGCVVAHRFRDQRVACPAQHLQSSS